MSLETSILYALDFYANYWLIDFSKFPLVTFRSYLFSKKKQIDLILTLVEDLASILLPLQ